MGAAEDAIAALDNPYRWDLVVFTARDFPPPPQAMSDLARRVKTYHVALTDDGRITKEDVFAASMAGNIIASHFAGGKRVLVTCLAGRNRAGLITALALRTLSGASGEAAARHVKMRRIRVEKEALSNPAFMALLRQLPSRERVQGHVRLDRTG